MPTPSPIITPIVVAKSGMVNTLLSRVSATEPAAMPASAVPIGKPVASTEPNARVRMITAKPMPSSSEDGASNEENAWPPYSMFGALDGRRDVLDLRRHILEVVLRGVAGEGDRGVGDLARVGALAGDLARPAVGVRAGHLGHAVDLGHLVEVRLELALHRGIGDRSVRRVEDDRAALAGTDAAEAGIEDVQAALALDAVGQSELGGEARADAAGDRADEDETDDPAEDDTSPTAIGERAQPSEH